MNTTLLNDVQKSKVEPYIDNLSLLQISVKNRMMLRDKLICLLYYKICNLFVNILFLHNYIYTYYLLNYKTYIYSFIKAKLFFLCKVYTYTIESIYNIYRV